MELHIVIHVLNELTLMNKIIRDAEIILLVSTIVCITHYSEGKFMLVD